MVKRVKTSPKVAVAYLRASTDDQKLGPEAQRASIEAWAAREGVHVAEWCLDQGVSGATPIAERAGLLRALSALREHGAGVLVAAKRDRLARDVVVAATLDRAVRNAGAAVRTADGMSDAAGPEGRFMCTILDGAAEYERALIRTRTTAALAAKKAKGERVGHVPYGQQLAADGVHLEANEAEQSTLALVRSLSAEGKSSHGIARELNARGLRSRTGREWLQTQVYRMLTA